MLLTRICFLQIEVNTKRTISGETSTGQEEMLVNSVGVVERLITLDLKSRGCNRSEGSNPSAYVFILIKPL